MTHGRSRPPSERELQVMEQVWRHGVAGPAEIRDQRRCELGRTCSYNTIATALGRLAAKGWLSHRGRGLWAATVSRDAYLEDQVVRAVDRVVAEYGDFALVQAARRLAGREGHSGAVREAIIII